MHLLPCDSCGHLIEVSPGQAGDKVVCPACGEIVNVPLLGHLRSLPLANQEVSQEQSSPEWSLGARMLFGASGLLTLLAVIFATFALVVSVAIKVEYDLERHLADEEEYIMQSSPAELVQRWDTLTQQPMIIRLPFQYQVDADRKAGWRRRAVIGYGIAAVGLLTTIATTRLGRKR